MYTCEFEYDFMRFRGSSKCFTANVWWSIWR